MEIGAERVKDPKQLMMALDHDVQVNKRVVWMVAEADLGRINRRAISRNIRYRKIRISGERGRLIWSREHSRICQKAWCGFLSCWTGNRASDNGRLWSCLTSGIG